MVKINITDISSDLHIPKESVRRKLQELEKTGVIKKTEKKIFLDRSAFIVQKPESTLREFSALINKFNEILAEEKVTNNIFDTNEISESIKANFSFCWYQYYKFIFIFTNRWRNNISDLETLAILLVVLLNTLGNKSFKAKNLNRKSWVKISQGADDVGVNAMSISDITGIPRPTVVRKLKYLLKSNFLHINKKKLLTMNITGSTLKKVTELQDLNMINLSNFLFRIFNQIKITNIN